VQKKFIGFCACGDYGAGVINFIPLASARVEVVGQLRSRLS